MATRAREIVELAAENTLGATALEIPELISLRSNSHTSSRTGPRSEPATPAWALRELAGRLVELSARGDSTRLSLTFSLVLDAQGRGEPVAWITDTDSCFFPPDVAACGVDLEALAVVRVPTGRAPGRSGPRAIARAAELLIRSGAFGLVVLDLGEDPRVPVALQSRLRGLAQKHETAVLCLTEKSRGLPSIGSMVSLRGEARRNRPGHVDDGDFDCEMDVIKDKKRGPGWTHVERRVGPDGLY